MKRVIVTGIVAVGGGIATVLFMPSCDPECEAEAKPSVIVEIVAKHQSGDLVENITAEEVWYEWTGEHGEKNSGRAQCMDDDCTEWMLGDGSPGTYVYHATVCGQQYESSVMLERGADGCGVDTQMVEFAVEACTSALAVESPRPPSLDVESATSPKVCTLEARPSVLVSVAGEVDSHIVAVAPDRVFYEVLQDAAAPEQPSSGELPGMCLNEDCSLFAAGFEQAGDFTVGAEACGQTLTANITVGKTSNGCHVETEQVRLLADVSKCNVPVAYAPPLPPKPTCEGVEMAASAFVLPVTDGGDVWIPFPTEQLIYVHDGVQHRAHCAQETFDGRCTMWVTGWGQTGRFQAFTEACEIMSAVTYSVEMSEDGCSPETEFVPVFVDTYGCIRSAWPPKGNPPPTTPAVDDEITE